MVIADVSVMPLRPYSCEEGMYKVVDACISEIEKSGLNYEVGAMSTTIEGDFDHKIPFNLGCERVITIARIDEKAGGITINEKLKNHR